MEEHTWVLTFAPKYLKHKCTKKLVAVSWKESSGQDSEERSQGQAHKTQRWA